MSDIWIIDDDRAIRWVLEKALSRERLSFRSFASADEALEKLRHSAALPRLLLSDLRMPGTSGLELLRLCKARFADLPIIIMTAYSDLESTVSALKGGAFEYLSKPFDVGLALALIRRALAARDEKAAAKMATTAAEAGREASAILSQAPAMQEIFRAVGRLASSGASALISGEAGVGKTLLARALHRHSPQAEGAFMPISAALLSEATLADELFGHEPGAFAGAAGLRRGCLEEAAGGSVFFEEIAALPPALQPRLWRALEDGCFYRQGGSTPLAVRVRLIAATRLDLGAEVAAGRFHEGLWQRLRAVALHVPPLRERRADILPLAQHFLASFADEAGVPPRRLSPAAADFLVALDFPGNVRQLENLCQWLHVMAPGQEIELADLPAELRAAGRGRWQSVWEEALANETGRLLAAGADHIFERLEEAFQRTVLGRALAHTAFRRADAAHALGIGRNTITRKIHELGLATKEASASPAAEQDEGAESDAIPGKDAKAVPGHEADEGAHRPHRGDERGDEADGKHR